MQRPMPTRLAATALVLAAALGAAGQASAGPLVDTARAVAAQAHPAARPGPAVAPAPTVVPARETHRPAPQPMPVHEVRRPAPAVMPAREFHRPWPAYQPGYSAPRVVVTQAPIYVQSPPQYVQADWNTCGAPGWDPNVRYMPGQVVRRQGNLYIATDVSAAVWNVNSPPEWTPSYWVPAVCSQ